MIFERTLQIDMIDARRSRDSIYVRVFDWKILKEDDQSRIEFQEVMTNEIIQEWEQCRVFKVSRVVAVNEVASFIFEILFIEKTSHDEKCVQV